MSSTLLQKRLITILLVLATAINAVAQERFALLIGIGEYPKTSGWSAIHGDNDVVIIKQLLIEQGF